MLVSARLRASVLGLSLVLVAVPLVPKAAALCTRNDLVGDHCLVAEGGDACWETYEENPQTYSTACWGLGGWCSTFYANGQPYGQECWVRIRGSEVCLLTTFDGDYLVCT